MKAFWWFKENYIAGMARPGFNAIHWLDLPFDETAVMGWIGQYSEGPISLESFRHHLQTYVPKIFTFHNIDEEAGHRIITKLSDKTGFIEALNKLNDRTGILETFFIQNDNLHFKLCDKRLEHEVNFLKGHGIRHIISLTEKHHRSDSLKDHFNLRHIAIADLGAPKIEQVMELAHLIQSAQERGEKLAVHCMAGIGRTSTMLLASHLVLGERAENLEALMKRQNPKFALTNSQRDLIHSLSRVGPSM